MVDICDIHAPGIDCFDYIAMSSANEPFYIRYYSGHSGRFGHEFLGLCSSFLLPNPVFHLQPSSCGPCCG